MSAPWPHGDPRDVARAIVADPRFHGITTAQRPSPTLVDLIVTWIGDRLRSVVAVFDRVLGANHPLARVLGIAVLCAAIGLIAWIVFRLVAGYLRSLPPRALRASPVALADDARSAAELASLAVLAAREGRLRDAARLRFTAALRLVDERGLVPFDAARTPGEYRRLVRRAEFDALARDAVTALFAATDPAMSLIERMQRTYDALHEAVGA